MNAENVAKKGQNILSEAATKPKTECPILSRYFFFCNVIVIANVNRHFVIDRSENVKERVISQGTLERKELFDGLNDFVLNCPKMFYCV